MPVEILDPTAFSLENPGDNRRVAVALGATATLCRAGAPITPVLPLLFQLRNKPYSLDWSHFMFEPMFRFTDMPRKMLWRCARQVSKSTCLAASQIMFGVLKPYSNLLTIMPLQEQVRKFSVNYVRPFITGSPFRSLIASEDGDSVDAVLQRKVGDNSNLFYLYSSGDPSRTRGIPADGLYLDEVQDSDLSDIPILEANLSASPWKLIRMAGTPKTFDNTIQVLWDDSSQAHWYIPCGCGYVNRAAVDGDLLKMIGPVTLSCAQCQRALDSRAGWWQHDFPERQLTFPGYHVPQPVLPMHYESPRDWQVLLDFQRTKPAFAFHNEILGESYDTGSKMITWDELQKACSIDATEPENMPFSMYTMRALGVDWGGRGKEKASDSEDFISNTAMALAGLCADGTVDVRWLHKVPYEVDMSHETEMAVNVCTQAQGDYIGLDYGGQGNVQEQVLRAHGWPISRIMPFTYSVMAPNRPIVFFQASKKAGVRVSYTLDKPRSLLLLCELIKRGIVRLPRSDRYMNDHIRDFLNIYEESMDNPSGSPRRLVKRMARRTDDIVHAVNFAVMTLFHLSGAWPTLANAFIDGGGPASTPG